MTRPVTCVDVDGRTPAQQRRCCGERGAGMVTGLVVLFAFTAAAVVWLARDVDRAISNRGAAQSIAFQAARTGAQQVDLERLRVDGAVVLHEPAATTAGVEVAERLLDAYGLTGAVVEVEVAGDRMTVVVEVTDGGRAVTGVGTARASDGSDVP